MGSSGLSIDDINRLQSQYIAHTSPPDVSDSGSLFTASGSGSCPQPGSRPSEEALQSFFNSLQSLKEPFQSMSQESLGGENPGGGDVFTPANPPGSPSFAYPIPRAWPPLSRIQPPPNWPGNARDIGQPIGPGPDYPPPAELMRMLGIAPNATPAGLTGNNSFWAKFINFMQASQPNQPVSA